MHPVNESALSTTLIRQAANVEKIRDWNDDVIVM